MFFSKFDKIQYNGKTVTDITNSILVKYRPMNNATLYTYHTIVDGESPESLAHKYFGNATDHWIIIILNTIVDPYFDWVLTQRELTAHVNSLYGDGNGQYIHHLVDITTRKRLDEVDQAKYVNNLGQSIGVIPQNIHPVSNIEYETSKNDLKRDIKILAPQYVQDFKNQFEDLMNREGLG